MYYSLIYKNNKYVIQYLIITVLLNQNCNEQLNCMTEATV